MNAIIQNNNARGEGNPLISGELVQRHRRLLQAVNQLHGARRRNARQRAKILDPQLQILRAISPRHFLHDPPEAFEHALHLRWEVGVDPLLADLPPQMTEVFDTATTALLTTRFRTLPPYARSAIAWYAIPSGVLMVPVRANLGDQELDTLRLSKFVECIQVVFDTLILEYVLSGGEEGDGDNFDIHSLITLLHGWVSSGLHSLEHGSLTMLFEKTQDGSFETSNFVLRAGWLIELLLH